MPLSNGVSETANCTIIGTTHALLHAVSASKQFWAEGAIIAIYVHSGLPTRAVQTGVTL